MYHRQRYPKEIFYRERNPSEREREREREISCLTLNIMSDTKLKPTEKDIL